MKKLISLLVVATLLVASLATVAFAAEGAQITVESVEAPVGEEVTLKVSIANNPGFAATKIVIEYDDGLELVGVDTKGMLLEGAAENDEKGIVSFAKATNVTEDGVLMTVTFKVIAAGEHSVNAVVKNMTSADTKDVTYEAEEGTVSTGHTCKLVDVAEVPATCTEPGVKAHQKCEECGKLYVDGKEVTAADLVIPAAGHNFGGEWKYDDAQHWYVCTVCGEECGHEAHTWIDGICFCGHENKGPAPTGDIAMIIFALAAVSGTGLVTLTGKKKEN